MARTPERVAPDSGLNRDRRLLSDVSRPVEQVFASVQALGDAMLELAGGVADGSAPLSRRDLARLEPEVAGLLRHHGGFVAGAGIVAAEGTLADAPLWIEWWWLAPEGAIERLEVDLDPQSPEFYDYTTNEWFREPRRTSRRHIAGPYVDYICTREYTFTVSVPLIRAGRFLGVAGADILAARVEQMVGRSLDELPCVAALASAGGRIISSNTAALAPGAILERTGQGAALRAVAGPGGRAGGAALPWVLLTGEARTTVPGVAGQTSPL